SPHFDLAPVSRDMLPYLYQLAISTETGYRWRFRGAVPTYETFEATFWQGALVQFIAVQRLNGSPAGHLVCYNPEHGHGYAYIGAVFDTEYVGSGAAVGAVRHFVDYVFTTWAFRKLYMETPAFNYEQFASGEGRYFDVEGRLLNHDYYAGRYWD